MPSVTSLESAAFSVTVGTEVLYICGATIRLTDLATGTSTIVKQKDEYGSVYETRMEAFERVLLDTIQRVNFGGVKEKWALARDEAKRLRAEVEAAMIAEWESTETETGSTWLHKPTGITLVFTRKAVPLYDYGASGYYRASFPACGDGGARVSAKVAVEELCATVENVCGYEYAQAFRSKITHVLNAIPSVKLPGSP